MQIFNIFRNLSLRPYCSKIGIFLSLISSFAFAGNEKSLDFWQGHKIRSDFGIFTTFNSPNNLKPGFNYGPMFELGYEYGGIIGKSWYLGVDATFTAFVPDSFEHQIIQPFDTHVGPGWAILLPILHFHAGYITSSNTLITIGTVYGWGFTSTIRQPLQDNWFVEAKVVWWLDRVFFNKGIHDVYFTVGGGIRF